ncbi:MAG: SUMF1/EgtB/PvdO family nonheme iron enzyme [Prolixibacteraceae bacterium]
MAQIIHKNRHIGLSLIKATGNSVIDNLIRNMEFVKGGKFRMGAEDKEAENCEKPSHDVILSDYFISRYSVSEVEWETVINNDSNIEVGKNIAKGNISWIDCNEFIKCLNHMTGLIFDLPSEAQWEFAARGGNLSKGFKYSGSNNVHHAGWCEVDLDYWPFEMGLKIPNELGLYDMSGYQWEWCKDWFGKYQPNLQLNPCGSSNGRERVIRGGCSVNKAKYCRVSARSRLMPLINGISINEIGFRIVINPQFNEKAIPFAIREFRIVVDGDFFCAIFGRLPIYDEKENLIENDGITEVYAISDLWWTACTIVLLRLTDTAYLVRIITDPEWNKPEVYINIETNPEGRLIGFKSQRLTYIPMEVISLLLSNGFLVDSKFEHALFFKDVKQIT